VIDLLAKDGTERGTKQTSRPAIVNPEGPIEPRRGEKICMSMSPSVFLALHVTVHQRRRSLRRLMTCQKSAVYGEMLVNGSSAYTHTKEGEGRQ
jgi:hypothetical protein